MSKADPLQELCARLCPSPKARVHGFHEPIAGKDLYCLLSGRHRAAVYSIAGSVQILMHHPNEGDHEFLFIIGHALPDFGVNGALCATDSFDLLAASLLLDHTQLKRS